MLAAVIMTPKEDLKNDQEEDMFFKGKTYTLKISDQRFITEDEQGLKNIMSAGYIQAHFLKTN